MKTVLTSISIMLLTGCASVFSQAVHSLPSMQNCHDVSYIRHGSDVDIRATCSVPMKSDPLIDVPVMP